MNYYEEDKTPKVIITILLILIVFSGFVGYFIGKNYKGTPTGGVTIGDCPEQKCELKQTSANVQIIGDRSISGKGNLLGINPKIKVKVKNLEEKQPVGAYVEIKCKTLKRGEQVLRSKKEYLGPGEPYTFTIEYDIGNEDWSCYDFKAQADAINSCELKTV